MLTVDAPPVDKARGGLLSVATVVPNQRATFEGIAYEARPLGPAHAIPTSGPKTFDRRTALTGEPFSIYRGIETSLFQRGETGSINTEAFTLGESFAVEEAIQPLLNAAADDITPTPGTAVLVDHAYALLEQYIAERYSARATLHVNRFGATIALDKGLMNDSKYPFETKLGSLLAVGAGYGADGPDAITATATQFWVYVTGQVVLYQGTVVDIEAPDLTLNLHRSLQERTYVPVIEGPVAAVLAKIA